MVATAATLVLYLIHFCSLAKLVLHPPTRRALKSLAIIPPVRSRDICLSDSANFGFLFKAVSLSAIIGASVPRTYLLADTLIYL